VDEERLVDLRQLLARTKALTLALSHFLNQEAAQMSVRRPVRRTGRVGRDRCGAGGPARGGCKTFSDTFDGPADAAVDSSKWQVGHPVITARRENPANYQCWYDTWPAFWMLGTPVNWPDQVFTDAFHTFAVDWAPDSITWSGDGTVHDCNRTAASSGPSARTAPCARWASAWRPRPEVDGRLSCPASAASR